MDLIIMANSIAIVRSLMKVFINLSKCSIMEDLKIICFMERGKSWVPIMLILDHIIMGIALKES